MDAFLRAHSFVQVERPPELWEAAVEEEPFVRFIGELLAVGLARGNELADLTLNVSNLVVPREAAGEKMPAGDYVAVTLRGRGDWGPDALWWPATPSAEGHMAALENPMLVAGAKVAYARDLADEGGSITVLFPRLEG